VVVANGLALPVFCWHMTALVVAIGVYERAGFTLPPRPTAAWWATRPLWLVGPALVLAAGFAAVSPARRGRSRTGN
jgi:hypothetical protein